MSRFSVSYTFRGTMTEIIDAEDFDAAKALIDDKVENGPLEIEPDEIDDVRFHMQQLHPVTRDGREMWTTFVMMGDVRGHQSALDTGALFAHYKEAALLGAAA